MKISFEEVDGIVKDDVFSHETKAIVLILLENGNNRAETNLRSKHSENEVKSSIYHHIQVPEAERLSFLPCGVETVEN